MVIFRLAPFSEGRKALTAACHKQIVIGLHEGSVMERRKRVRSSMSRTTTARFQIIRKLSIETMVPDRKYEDFHGSTRNDMITLVTLPPYELVWMLPLKDKIALYNNAQGSRRIVMVHEML